MWVCGCVCACVSVSGLSHLMEYFIGFLLRVICALIDCNLFLDVSVVSLARICITIKSHQKSKQINSFIIRSILDDDVEYNSPPLLRSSYILQKLMKKKKNKQQPKLSRWKSIECIRCSHIFQFHFGSFFYFVGKRVCRLWFVDDNNNIFISWFFCNWKRNSMKWNEVRDGKFMYRRQKSQFKKNSSSRLAIEMTTTTMTSHTHVTNTPEKQNHWNCWQQNTKFLN